MQEAITEVEEYCQHSNWLNEIFKFCNSWNENSVEQWNGASGFLLEVHFPKPHFPQSSTLFHIRSTTYSSSKNLLNFVSVVFRFSAKTQRNPSMDGQGATI